MKNREVVALRLAPEERALLEEAMLYDAKARFQYGRPMLSKFLRQCAVGRARELLAKRDADQVAAAAAAKSITKPRPRKSNTPRRR